MVNERRRTPDSVGLELRALRVEHNFYANVRSLLVEALYMSYEERRMLERLEALISEVAAWGAAHGVPTDTMRVAPDQAPPPVRRSGVRRPRPH